MRDLNWFKSQIDEMFIEALRMSHKGKNIDEAIEQAYLHLMADVHRLNVADSADCKRLVNSWLSNKIVNAKASKILHDLQ